MKSDENKISKKYFIGKSVEKGRWASVYTYKPNSDEIYQTRGEIFAAISLSAPAEFNATTAGNLILDYFHETYFENQKDTTLGALEKAVTATSKHLQKLMQHDDNVSAGIDMDIVAMVAINQIIYFVSMGDSHVFVLRDGNLSQLSKYFQDPVGDGRIKIASMVAKSADVFLLGTPSVTEEVSQDELVSIAADFSDKLLKEKAYEDESAVAVMMVGYEVDEKEAKEEVALHERIKADVEESIERLEDGTSDQKQETESETEEEPQVISLGAASATDTEGEVDDDELQPEIGERINEAKTKISGFFKEKFSGNKKIKAEDALHRVPAADVTPRAERMADVAQDLTATADTMAEQPTWKALLMKAKIAAIGLFAKLKQLVWDKWLGMEDDGVYVRGSGHGRNRKVKMLIIVILVVGVVLYLSVTSILRGIENRELKRNAEADLQAAQELVAEVEELAPVKASASNSDPGKQELISKLGEAKTKLDSVGDFEEFDEQVSELNNTIQELNDLLSRVIAISSPRQVIDLAASYPGTDPSDLVLSNGSLYISDREYGKIYQVGINGSDPSEVISGLERPKTITADEKGNIVVLDENGENRLATVYVDTSEIQRHAGTSEFRVGNVSAIEFADIFGGRVYGIDQSSQKAIVLQRSGENYGIPQARFELAELANAPDLHVIDLKIYVLADINQGLYRFYNELDDSPLLTGLNDNENLYQASSIFVDAEHIYIADPVNRRILVFTKDIEVGNIVAQYQYRGSDTDTFTNLQEIIADRASGKLYALDGTKVYELELSSLANF